MVQQNEDSDLHTFHVASCISDSRFKWLVCLRVMILEVWVKINTKKKKKILITFQPGITGCTQHGAGEAPAKALQKAFEDKQQIASDEKIPLTEVTHIKREQKTASSTVHKNQWRLNYLIEYSLCIKLDYYKCKACIDSQINLESMPNFDTLTSSFNSVLGEKKKY